MTEGYRRLDRQLGAASVFDDSAHHLQRIVRLKAASMTTEHRRRLAAAAGEVASLRHGRRSILGGRALPGRTTAWPPGQPARRAIVSCTPTSWRRRATCCCSAGSFAKPSRWSSGRAIWREGRARGCGRGSPDASFVRARAGALVDLATLHLQQGEVDAACDVFGRAFWLARDTQSTKNQRRIIVVRRHLRPWNATAAVRNLDELLDWFA